MFSIIYVIGYNVAYFENSFEQKFNSLKFIFDIVNLIGMSYFLYEVIKRIINYLSDKSLIEQDVKIYSKTELIKHSIYIIFLLFISWGFYFIAFFPAIVTIDSYYQILQGFGYMQLTDVHPFVHTLLQGIILRFGTYFTDNIYTALAFMSIFQMICFSSIIAYAERTLFIKGFNKISRGLLVGFYALHPILASYSVILWKDIWISYFILFYIVAFYEIFDNDKITRANMVRLILGLLGILFFKSTGLYIFIISLPVTIYCLWKFKKSFFTKSILVLMSVLLIYGLTRFIVIGIYQIPKGNSQDTLSVPLQQIARTVKYNGEGITEEEKDILREILLYDALADAYDPIVSDPVKNLFDYKAFSADKVRYLKTWLSIGLRYPNTYIKSLLVSTYGYWYPDTYYTMVPYGDYLSIMDEWKDSFFVNNDPNKDKYVQNNNTIAFKYSVCSVINNMKNVPIISPLFGIASYFWVCIILFFICRIRNCNSLYFGFAIIFGVFISCIISPVFSEMRYAYPAVVSIPFLTVSTLGAKSKVTVI